MVQRSGTTLIEVLVAIFIMGIGLMALLALFPLGAMQMAQAIKDDRTGQIAGNAAAIARFKNVRNDTTVFAGYNSANNPSYPSGYSGPSYPVYVDPVGVKLTSSVVGGSTGSGIQRTGASFVSMGSSFPQDYDRWFTFLDDITFAENGTPDTSSGAVQREGRYTTAYLCRQVQQSTTNPTPAGVTLSVIVYERRVPQFSAGHLVGEKTYNATFNTGSNSAIISWTAGQEVPPIRKGVWLLENTNTTASPAFQHGYFYRVLGVSAPGSAGVNSMDVELHINAVASADASNGGTAVVMENVVEVFDRGASN